MSDSDITAEIWWDREIVTVPLDKLVDDLCTHYRVPRTNGGTKGNETHRKGRHRSIEWCLNSAFCTNPAYGTTDARDKRGNPLHIRAFDFEFPTADEFHAACRRLDAAVRAGRCPYLAEWFGTFDGRDVVGWFEGHPGSADRSHLEHLHGGLWTEFADDPAALAELFNIITGADMEQTDKLARPTANPNRTIGDHYYDEQNLRDWWYDAVGGKEPVNPPPPNSRADLLMQAVDVILHPKGPEPEVNLDVLADKVADRLAAKLNLGFVPATPPVEG